MFKRSKKKVKIKELWESFFKRSLKQDWQRAMPLLQEVIALEPRNTQAHLKMGDLLQKIGDKQGAVQSYHRSASALSDAGFGHKALALYKIILRLDPRDKTAIKGTDLILGKPSVTPLLALGIDEYAGPAAQAAPAPSSAGPPEDVPNAWGREEAEGRDDGFTFCSLQPDEAAEIMGRCSINSFVEGETVVREGDSGDSIFVIRKGTARVIAHFGGKEVELATLSVGEVFGEVAYLAGRPRTASVIATGDLLVVDISRDILQDAIKKSPKILDCLAEFYYDRVQDTLQKVKALR